MNRSPDTNSSDDVHVRVNNLVKHFVERGGLFQRNLRLVRAVDGVSFDIQRRRTVGIVGESGCGKTTLGRCMLRLIEPTSGEVYFDGEDILKLSSGQLRERRKDMQIVFQNPYASLDPRMSVLRIVGEPLRTHTSMSAFQVRERVVELLEQVGMGGHYLYRYPHEFSGGQLQRIAIARALALNPKFLVLDEPTAALDVSVQAQVIAQLTELQRNLQLTYLFISHNLTLVHYVSDSIAVLYLGKVVEHGDADEIFGNPVHCYTKALLSATPALDSEFRQQRIILAGGVPDPANPPSGCAFHPRCADATDACSEVAPTLVDVGGGHLVACHRVNGKAPVQGAKTPVTVNR
jgi:oligopeptide/dipeptide ABC transporter ATP-binding protein